MGIVSPQANEPYEEELLARAYRALLGNEGFDDLLRDLAETARSHTSCDEVVIGAIDANGLFVASEAAWTSGSSSGATGDPLGRTSLPMPVVSDGRPTHVMTFYKSDQKGRFTPAEVEHARRFSKLAALIVSGTALVGGFVGLSGIDDETGVLIRRGFEDDLLDALSANDGRAASSSRASRTSSRSTPAGAATSETRCCAWLRAQCARRSGPPGRSAGCVAMSSAACFPAWILRARRSSQRPRSEP
jgi:hypothetical protein